MTRTNHFFWIAQAIWKSGSGRLVEGGVIPPSIRSVVFGLFFFFNQWFWQLKFVGAVDPEVSPIGRIGPVCWDLDLSHF